MTFALQAAATGVQAAGAIMEGYQKAAGLKANAHIADNNADLANRTAAGDADNVLRQGRQQIGAQSAAAAQNGLGFSGSVSDSLNASATGLQMDANNAIYGGRLKETGYRNDASGLRAQASNAVTAGWIGAASTLLGGAGDFMKNKTPGGDKGGGSGIAGTSLSPEQKSDFITALGGG